MICNLVCDVKNAALFVALWASCSACALKTTLAPFPILVPQIFQSPAPAKNARLFVSTSFLTWSFLTTSSQWTCCATGMLPSKTPARCRPSWSAQLTTSETKDLWRSSSAFLSWEKSLANSCQTFLLYMQFLVTFDHDWRIISCVKVVLAVNGFMETSLVLLPSTTVDKSSKKPIANCISLRAAVLHQNNFTSSILCCGLECSVERVQLLVDTGCVQKTPE